MPTNPFTQEENLRPWFEADKDFRGFQRQELHKYLHQHHLNRSPFMSFQESYLNFVNLITKNAVVATIVMIIALGGMTTAAAQFFAPEEYKPSNLLFPQAEQKAEKETFTHPNLTGFSFDYYSDWDLTVNNAWGNSQVKDSAGPGQENQFDGTVTLQKGGAIIEYSITTVYGIGMTGEEMQCTDDSSLITQTSGDWYILKDFPMLGEDKYTFIQSQELNRNQEIQYNEANDSGSGWVNPVLFTADGDPGFQTKTFDYCTFGINGLPFARITFNQAPNSGPDYMEAVETITSTQFAPDPLAQKPIQEPVNDNPAQGDETGDWQTYQNDRYDFSLKYPSDYIVYDDWDAGEPAVSRVLEIYHESLKGAEGQGVRIYMDTYSQDKDWENLDQFAEWRRSLFTSASVEPVNGSNFSAKAVDGQADSKTNGLIDVTEYVFTNNNRYFVFGTVKGFGNQENFARDKQLAEQIFQTIKLGNAENKESDKLTYTNPYFPDFKVDYTSDWQMVEEISYTDVPAEYSETRQAVQGYNLRLNFKKNGVTLQYNVIDQLGGIGAMGMFCTNNENLFLEADNGWFRIRRNDGSRDYNNQVSLNHRVTEDMSMGGTSPGVDSNKEWVFQPDPNQTYKACASNIILSTQSPNNPYSYKRGIANIQLNGLNSNNWNTGVEADQIVATTKF